MSYDVTLGAGMRTNLLNLQRTSGQIDRVQNILSLGLKVGSAIDNPKNFFAAQGLSATSANLLSLLDSVGQSVSTIKAASSAADAIKGLLEQANSIVSSAREAVADGEIKASITGNKNLAGISNLTAVAGVTNGDDIVFQYYNTSNALTPATINIATNDSIDELMTHIKDIGGGGYFDAKLTSDGYLKITELRGNKFNVNFTTDNNSNTLSANDAALSSALGFGTTININTRTGGASSNANAEITILSSTKLTSGTFYEAGGAANGLSESSDLLSTVVDSLGGTTARFVNGSAGDPLNLTFTINGTTTSANINLEGLSIQGLVDAINNDVNVGSKLDATYDGATGKLAINIIDASVNTININVTDTIAGGASTTKVDFGFGIKTFLPGTGANDAQGETFLLGSAASTLLSLQTDYDSVRSQIDTLASDGGYQGTNLVTGGTLDTYFNSSRTNKLSTTGLKLTSSSLGLGAADFSTTDKVTASETAVSKAQASVSSFASSLATSLSIIQTREGFMEDYANILKEGADKLTVADQNEEGAKLLALKTRQELGTTSLALGAQAQQSVLRLFGAV